ncbi:hypothetical protein Tco_0678170 [Tanacetum coccineum]|uniref:Uncharacterized protein n=1 Tax=Tanacetum coccineum TaxID=301880 RepID=A0ABQ4XEI2_9ASTR
MRADELYQFSDGTLKTIRDELHHRILDFRLGYNEEMSRRKYAGKKDHSEFGAIGWCSGTRDGLQTDDSYIRLTISPNVEVFFDLPNIDVLDGVSPPRCLYQQYLLVLIRFIGLSSCYDSDEAEAGSTSHSLPLTTTFILSPTLNRCTTTFATSDPTSFPPYHYQLTVIRGQTEVNLPHRMGLGRALGSRGMRLDVTPAEIMRDRGWHVQRWLGDERWIRVILAHGGVISLSQHSDMRRCRDSRVTISGPKVGQRASDVVQTLRGSWFHTGTGRHTARGMVTDLPGVRVMTLQDQGLLPLYRDSRTAGGLEQPELQ